jgi:hypothetical protein
MAVKILTPAEYREFRKKQDAEREQRGVEAEIISDSN